MAMQPDLGDLGAMDIKEVSNALMAEFAKSVVEVKAIKAVEGLSKKGQQDDSPLTPPHRHQLKKAIVDAVANSDKSEISGPMAEPPGSTGYHFRTRVALNYTFQLTLILHNDAMQEARLSGVY